MVGMIDPPRQEAKAAVEKAKQAVRDAEQAKSEAAGNLDKAKEDNNIASQRYLEAKDNLANAEETLKNSQSDLEKLKDELGKLESQKSELEKSMKEFESAEPTIEALKTEIPKQQTRLAELEQQERDGLSAAEDTIMALKDKMSGKDGILGNSDDKSLGSRDSKKYKDAVDAQRNVGYTDLYKQEPTAVVHGVQFRTGQFNGETLYMVGSEAVSEGEYNLAMTRYELLDKAENG